MGDSGRPALLIDLFDTLVATDFDAIHVELAAFIGCSPVELSQIVESVGAPLMTTRHGIATAFRGLLHQAGRPSDDTSVAELISVDQQLLVAHSRVLDDARTLVERVRGAGWRTALVSNCAPNAAAVVAAFGIEQWVDAVVLSCDVGAVKPDARIFDHACEQLDVGREDAVFVDDQLKYCQGAADLGIESFWIDRIAHGTSAMSPRVTRVASCDEVLANVTG